MDRQQRIDFILDHYEHPRHAGRLEPADVVVSGSNPVCGDVVTVYLRATGHDQPAVLSYEGRGCTISQAAASMVMDLVQGLTLAEIDAASAQPLLDLLGPDIASTRQRCATLAFKIVKEAVRQYNGSQLPAAMIGTVP